MCDYSECIIVRCLPDPHSLGMTVGPDIFAAITAIDITDGDNFGATLEQHVTVNMKITVMTAWLTTTYWKLAVDSKMFAQDWGIPPHKAEHMVPFTAQCDVMDIAIPTLTYRSHTNNCML